MEPRDFFLQLAEVRAPNALGWLEAMCGSGWEFWTGQFWWQLIGVFSWMLLLKGALRLHNLVCSSYSYV